MDRRKRRLAWFSASALLLLLLLGGGVRSFGQAAGDAAAADPIRRLIVEPLAVRLDGRDAEVQLLIGGETAAGAIVDLTRTAEMRIESKANGDGKPIASIATGGIVAGLADGEGQLQIEAGGQSVAVPVTVTNATVRRAIHFDNDLVPILSRFGCNAAGCHGKAEGQNGFKLSVFGFDPAADHQAIVAEARGRRVFPAAPERSLLLQKAAGLQPHGGGVRIARERPEFRTLHDWIAAGMPRGEPTAPRVVEIVVSPPQRRLAMNDRQQLRVVAKASDGREFDVTRLATFQTNNEGLATVDEAGLVTAGEAPGVVAVMASYLGHVGVFQAMIPRRELIPPDRVLANAATGAASASFIDRRIDERLAQLNILPSPPCSDADFLRRVSIDLIGTLPTAAEAREFLADTSPDRREKLVERLMQRPEFADYWALKWADLLRVDRQVLGHKAAYRYYRWIRDSFSQHKPLDQFARELLTAEGPLAESPAAHFYKVVRQPNEIINTVSQTLLGVRLECAQCHQHPADRWSQADYFSMQAFFTQVSLKTSPLGDTLLAAGSPRTTHPRTGEELFAHPLTTPMPAASPEGDRRRVFAEWLTAKDNPFFARNLANRTWAHLMGRGLIEPVDDVRSTNPPSHPELLDELAQRLIDSGFDFRELIRAITASAAYQRSSEVNETNARDEQNFSRFLLKPLEAEVLLDAICQTTGVPEKFEGVPAGSRAVQLWDSGVSHYLLKLFGRPVRATACQCERVSEPTVSQVLHVLNSPEIQAKLSHAGGRIASLVASQPDNGLLVDELYLTFFARPPSADQRTAGIAFLQNQPDRQQAAEDLAWSMLNSVEFLFNH